MAINESITVRLVLNVTGWNRRLREAARAAETFRQRVRRVGLDVNRDFERGIAGGARASSREFNRAERSARRLGRAAQRSARDGSQAFRRLRTDSNRFDRQNRRTIRRIVTIRDTLFELGQLARVGAFFGDAIQATREFDRALREVVTIIPDGTLAFEDLEAGVKRVSLALGVETPKAAKAAYQAISASVDARQAIAFIEQAGKLAVAGVTDIEKSVDLLTSVINSYSLQVTDAAAVSDSLFETVRLGKTTIGELSAVFGRVAPFARQAGASIVETEAALAALTATGLSTREASTQLRQLLAAIIKPTRDALTAANSLGFEFSSAAVRAKGLAEFLFDLRAAAEANDIPFSAFFRNVRSLAGALTLTGAQAGRFVTNITEIEGAVDSTDKAFDKIAEGIDFKLLRITEAGRQGFEDLGQGLVEFGIALFDTGEGIAAAQQRLLGFFKLMQVGIGFILTAGQTVATFVEFIVDSALSLVDLSILTMQTIAQGVEGVLLNLAKKWLQAVNLIPGINKVIDIEGALQGVETRLRRFEKNAFFVGERIKQVLGTAADRIVQNTQENTATINRLWDATIKRAGEANAAFAAARQEASNFALNLAGQFAGLGGGASGFALTQRGLTPGDQAQQQANDLIRRLEERGAEGLLTAEEKRNLKRLKKETEKERKRQEREAQKAAKQEERNAKKQSRLDEKFFEKEERQARDRSMRIAKALGVGFEDEFGSARFQEAINASVALPFIRAAESAGERINATFEQFGLLFRRLGPGISIAEFTAPVGPQNRTDRLLQQSLARQRAQEDRSGGTPAQLRGAGFGTVGGGGSPLFFGTGGRVPGSGNSDSVSAQLTPGEFVINKEASSRFLPILQQINRTSAPVPSSNNMNMTNNFNFGGGAITVDVIRTQIIPEIKFQMRMGQF